MTLHDGLDLFATLEDMTVSMRNKKVYRKEYVDNLRNALEAALAVIEADGEYTRDPRAKQKQHDLTEELKLRLMPFRKEGLG